MNMIRYKEIDRSISHSLLMVLNGLCINIGLKIFFQPSPYEWKLIDQYIKTQGITKIELIGKSLY
jgi:hypothetical protein